VLAEAGVDMFKEEKTDLIVVDTSGRHKQQAELFEEMQQVDKAVVSLLNFYINSATPYTTSVFFCADVFFFC
jgi:signal recognition particle GTPase